MEIIVGPYGMQSPHPYRRPHVELYDELIVHAQRAEELGFDGIALTEHSFWYDGYCPSLLPTLAAVSQHTERIKLVTGALLLPQHDPLKVAEEAAVVDRLSGGRLVLGMGAGYRPEEFLGHGVPEGRWGARLFEAMEVVRLALTEGTFSFHGDFYDYDKVSLATRPVQNPPPLWVCAGFADWSAKGSGRRGWAYCTTGDVEGGGSIFDLYEEAAIAAGHDRASMKRGLFRDVLVMPSEHEVTAIAEEDFWPAFNDQFLGFGFLKRMNPDGEQITELPIELKDMFIHNPRNAVGTPESVREQMKPVIEMDLDLLIVRTIWANFKHERTLRTMETFANEVMPHLRAESRRRQEQER
ncbi:MAG: LLM class flavin-dependent oxidoreductase [Acidimicrobiia bacterium]|nr:LLM class flavin-dependent oxidoreductase [Acidimicrobiia bacterium]